MSVFDHLFGGRAVSDELARKRLEEERAALNQGPTLPTMIRADEQSVPSSGSQAQTIDPTQLVPAPPLPADPATPASAKSDDVGVLGRIFGMGDQTPDPNTGLTRSDRSQLGFSTLAQLGAVLAAAGQPMAPAQRAQILAQMGSIPQNNMQMAGQIGQQRAWREIQSNRTELQLEKLKAAQAKKDQAGPFAGTSMDAQARNIVLTGDPSTAEYAAAYAHLSEAKVSVDPSGRPVVVTPDMSWARPPLRQGAGSAPNGSSPPASSGSSSVGQTIPGQTTTRLPNGQTVSVGETPTRATAKEIQDLRTARIEGESIVQTLDDFRTEWKKSGTADFMKSLLGGTTGLNTSYNVAALLAKGEQLFNLGVLNGPDLDIIRRTLPDPSNYKTVFTSEKDMEAAVTKVRNLVLSKLEARERQLGIAPPQAQQASPTSSAPPSAAPSRADVEAEMRRRGLIK